MTGFDSKRKIAMDRLDDDDVQIYAQPTLKGKIMTEDEEQTLAALKYAASMGYPSSMLKDMFTIREALAQPPLPVQEEKVAGVAYVDDLDLWHFCPLQETVNFPNGTKFYTTPQQRTWVGLTDEEIAEYLGHRYHVSTKKAVYFFKIGLQAAKEINT
jgi:hypothetical protein